MDELHECGSLCEALTRAARDVAPTAGSVSRETLAAALQERLIHYWGAGHGIGSAELLNIAADIKGPSKKERHYK
ncbi:hypothetical protein P4U43_06295 [Arthrobacter sp. EH-1B-1]|uniref:Uncharacterized protein n=1 Tax=Arthrobacter vasquezii TaxID=2977629 RepID=A0ABT6CTK8_9MICC|nr:hypothetical protein [Arthrobacter vasquezii]MDF9277402.1 hypothetical protein [Arthrobacter vasquezii]